MNNISINISGKIDPEKIKVLRNIKDVADDLGIPFFVVGTFAREVIFEHILFEKQMQTKASDCPLKWSKELHSKA